MTDTLDIAARIVKIARLQGLGHLDMAQLVEAVTRSGAIDQADDSVVADRCHAHASRVGGGQPVDPFAAFLAKQGLKSLDGVAIDKRNRLRAAFAAQQSEPAAVDAKAQFETRMQAQHGADWQSKLTPTEKMTLGALTDRSKPNLVLSHHHKLRAELASLKTSTGGKGNVNIEMARIARIARLERELQL